MSRGRTIKEITIEKVAGLGADLPPFLRIAQRHFEKAQTTVANDKQATVNLPIDLIELVVPPSLLSQIESIDVVYKKR